MVVVVAYCGLLAFVSCKDTWHNPSMGGPSSHSTHKRVLVGPLFGKTYLGFPFPYHFVVGLVVVGRGVFATFHL